MLSRSVVRFVAITFRNRKLLHQSIRCMDMEKSDAIKSHKFPNTSMNNGQDFVTMVKSTRNSYDFLNVISRNGKHFTAEETMMSLRKLHELQKDTTKSINQKDLLRNSDFQRLCQSLQRNGRHMEFNDLIDSLKIILFVGGNANTEVTMSLLNLIKQQINDVKLGHINLLDFLLGEMESTPLVDALKMALPMLLQVQISTKLDHENLTQLIDLLSFVSRRRVNDPCIMSIVSSLRLRADDLNPDQARRVVWSLSSSTLQIPKEYLERLLADATSAMSRGDIDKENMSAVSTTLDKMVKKYLDDPRKFEKFYDEMFFNKCADSVVQNDFGFEKAVFVQSYFNKLGFVHIEMLKYMLHEVEKYPGLIAESKPIMLTTLITALSQANFKPQNWDKIRLLILRSNLFTNEIRADLPFIKISLEMLSLGIKCPLFWDKIFSNKYLNELAHRRNERLLGMLELYQVLAMTDYSVEERIDEKCLIEAKEMLQSIVRHPLQQYMELAFGGPLFVFTKVRTKFGHIIDHVIAFDKETMQPAQIDGGFNHDVYYEDIATDDSKQYIAVLMFPVQSFCINMPILKATYQLKLQTYEKMGINAVPVNRQMWSELADDEKMSYIQSEVKWKVAQLQNVLQ